MHALPFAVSLACAALLARPLLSLLVEAGAVRANYRGRMLPCPFGVLLVLAALPAWGALLLVRFLGEEPSVLPGPAGDAVLLALGAGLLGLLDDAFGGGAAAGAPRGLRGHARALRGGRLTTGGLKAIGLPAVALIVVLPFAGSKAEWLLGAAVVLAATHAFNLLDLRPGRAAKAFVLLGAALTIGSRELRNLWAVGLVAGPALVCGLYDVRERAMLGDTGASVLGAVAGLWLVLTLSTGGQIAALVLLLLLAIYGELRSISSLIERTPGLRQLDSLGRPS